MKRLVCAALMMPALVWIAAAASAADTPTPTKGEVELAKLLEGHEPGDPVRCIPSRRQQRLHTIDGTAYVFGHGSILYVQRTTRPQDIDHRNALINRRASGGELCRMDLASTIDPIAGFFTGGVIFEDFIPYTRIAKTASAEGLRP
ncbi:MAG: hypothetical protein ACJLS3_15620 [Erythrobacter sp.]